MRLVETVGLLPAALVLICSPLSAVAQESQPPADLTELSLEDLARMEVTSVSRKRETRLRSPAAIYVISRDDIRRSGATTLVDALRLAPGVHVARVDSNTWAVGVRGFTSNLTRSVLVLIDGRPVYNPLFAGTYWEVQDVMLDAVERIEVIRGPGGTLWGANSVNGVINIITRSSRETPGTLVSLGGGTTEHAFGGVQFGALVSDEVSYRVYAKGFDRGPGSHDATPESDDWRMGQAGFRADWERSRSEQIKVQGDIYRGSAGTRSMITLRNPPGTRFVEDDIDLSGGNLLARWQRASPGGTEWAVRTFFDHTDRAEPAFRERRNTFDVDVLRRAAYGRHEIIAGAGYRVSSGTADSVSTIEFRPPHRTDHLWTAFLRDEVSFREGRYVLAAGAKLEHNGYSGFEVQPTVQALWAPSLSRSLWATLSRAVRTPSRIEHDLSIAALVDPRVPVFAVIAGDTAFLPESIVSFQVGHRASPGRRLTLDTVAFYNTHDDLLSVEPGTPFLEREPPPPHQVIPFLLRNGIEGRSYGLELAADWAAGKGWRLGATYSYLHLDLEASSASADTSTAASINGSSPRHMAGVESRLDLGSTAALDLRLRYVDDLPARSLDAYTTLDARLAWRPRTQIELALVGQNLLSPRHAEFPAGGGETIQVRRGAYAEVTWRP